MLIEPRPMEIVALVESEFDSAARLKAQIESGQIGKDDLTL